MVSALLFPEASFPGCIISSGLQHSTFFYPFCHSGICTEGFECFFSILGLLVKDQGKCQWRRTLKELDVCVCVCVCVCACMCVSTHNVILENDL